MQLRCFPHPRLPRAAEPGALCGASTAAAHQSDRAGQLQIPETLGPGVDYISQRPARPESSNPLPSPASPVSFNRLAGLLKGWLRGLEPSSPGLSLHAWLGAFMRRGGSQREVSGVARLEDMEAYGGPSLGCPEPLVPFLGFSLGFWKLTL